MKRIIFLVLLLLCISACASSLKEETGQEKPIEGKTIEIIEPEESVFDKTLSGAEDHAQITRSHPVVTGQQNTSGDLRYEDFDFYADILQNGIPEGAFWPQIRYMDGPWKYRLQIGEDPSTDSTYFDELGYADLVIDYDREIIVVTLHPRLASDGYAVYEESDEDVGYQPFEGVPEDGCLKLIGNDCVLWIGEYYAYEGREYVYGELYMSEEDYGIFLMTRGQE